MSQPHPQDAPTEPLSRPGSSFRRAFPAVMVVAVVVLAVWVVLGRALVDAMGPLAVVYALAIMLPVIALHCGAALLLRRDALNYPSHAVSSRAVVLGVTSWLALAVFGFFLPDVTAHGMQSVFTAVAGEQMRGITYGFANTFGVISVALSVAMLLLAVTDLRVTGRRLRGEALTEDEILDRAEAGRR